MVVVNPEKLVKLQRSPDSVRNICVLAHVDHGKTSLTDSLIATNGIISPKMAGKIRYLDSRPDEQIRGITMESSAISLFFSMLRKSAPEATPEQRDYLVNLIDSPGHVDFSSEVSTASRLCDGAIILVDAVEGVCSQTVAVLRQTWIEHLTPILVINKMDRLVTELRMTPGEANAHLNKLLEQVNAVVGGFFQGERMEDDLKWREKMENQNTSSAKSQSTNGNGVQSNDESVTQETLEAGGVFEEKDDEDIYFEPAKGNVIFSSATDGWAFTVKQFAGFYERKLGIKREILEKVLWGDFYLDPKTKRVLAPKHLKGRALKPMFVQLVLDNIWAVYDAAIGGDKGKGDAEKVEKITKSLSLNMPNHILRSRDPRAILTALFSAWVPLSTAMLVSVVEQIPSPKAAQATRMPGLLDSSPGSAHVDETIRDAVTSLKSSRSDPLVAFVSKMVSVPETELPENKTRSGQTLTADEARELGRKKRAEIARAQAAANGERPDVAELREALSNTGISEDSSNVTGDEEEISPEVPERLIGFARLFSGSLEVGDEVYVLHPKFNPANPHAQPEPQKVTITALYLLMGRGLEPLTSVPAGVVFGVAGLEGHLMKSGTLCSQLEGSVNLAGLSMGTQPIVRVALEPENPADLDKMVAGMRLLEQSDPCAAYEVLESGEHVILTAGELHLERCLKDLRERFARCEIQVGAPIVPYREGIVAAAEMNPPHDKNLPRGTSIGVVASKQVTIRLRARPLPANVTEFLLENAPTIRELYVEQIAEDHHEDTHTDESEEIEGSSSTQPAFVGDGHRSLAADSRSPVQKIKEGLENAFANVEGNRDTWHHMAEKVVAFGPRRNGPNILIDATQNHHCRQLALGTMHNAESAATAPSAHTETTSQSTPDISDKITYAFQLAASYGPLCQEPMQGVAVILEEITFTSDSAHSDLGRLGGEVIRTTRDAIRQGFLDWSPRLLLAMYSCEIQASTEVLGRVYGVVTRRRGKITSESMNEGTPFFTIVAEIPVAESFGFTDEIRKRTSGAASPQLIFRGFEMLDEDPFWVPFTEEELEDLGELADKENLAKKYMDGVRRRKGLFVAGKKLVESAEKQKTLKR